MKPYNNSFKIWESIKKKYSDAIVLVRNENHYLSFHGDAVQLNRLTGTQLQQDADELFCRFCIHELDTILRRITKAGMRMAVCDQI